MTMYEKILWIYIHCGDFDTVIFALPAILLITLFYWIIRRIWHKRKFGKEFKAVRKMSRLNETIRLLAACWAAALVCITLVRTEGWMHFWVYFFNLFRDDVEHSNPFSIFIWQGFGFGGIANMTLKPRILDYILNGHWEWMLWSAKSIFPSLILNIALFVPLGVAMPFVYKKASLPKALFIGFLLSFFIEFIQIFIGRQAETDDLICNTIGAVIGYLIYLLIKKLFPNFTEKGKQSANDFWIQLHNADSGTEGETKS